MNDDYAAGWSMLLIMLIGGVLLAGVVYVLVHAVGAVLDGLL